MVHGRAFAQLKPLAEQMGVKFSYMPLMIKATSLALTHFPELNATTNEDCSELTVHGAHNIGIAMDSPRGLIVPNVKAVQTRTLWDIATELNRLQELAHMGKLAEEDLTGGTFTCVIHTPSLGPFHHVVRILSDPLWVAGCRTLARLAARTPRRC